MKKLLLIISFGFIGLGTTLAVYHGHACALSGQESTTQRSRQAATAYVYTVKPGDNLTLLVRRSLQLYAQAKNIRVTRPALLYAETNAVQRLGGGQLEIGDSVRIPFDVLQTYLVKSRVLSRKQHAAWSAYVARVNFSVQYIRPTNQKAALRVTTPQLSSTSTEKQSQQNQSPTHHFPHKHLVFAAALLVICIVWVFPRKR